MHLAAIPTPAHEAPRSLAARFPHVSFTNRQRSLANRVLMGEDVRFGDLRPFDQEAALQLHRKGVMTFAPATNRLALVEPEPQADACGELRQFPDGSKAQRMGKGPWKVVAGALPGLAAIGCRAAEFAANANAGRR